MGVQINHRPTEVDMSDFIAHKRFVVLVKSNADVESGSLPTEQDLAAMTSFNEELVQSGAMLAGEGFLASTQGARLTYTQGDVRVQRGPSRIPSRSSPGTG
jgi:hypothetical protein